MPHCISCDNAGLFLQLSTSGLCMDCLENRRKSADDRNKHLRRVLDESSDEITRLNLRLEYFESELKRTLSESEKTISELSEKLYKSETQLTETKTKSLEAITRLIAENDNATRRVLVARFERVLGQKAYQMCNAHNLTGTFYPPYNLSWPIQELVWAKLLEGELCDLDEKIERHKAEYKKMLDALEEGNLRLISLKKMLLVAEDQIEIESFCLYKPKFRFQNVEDYEKRLKVIRNKERKLIRDKLAISTDQHVTLNNDKLEGKNLVSKYSKSCLRSFNNECDITIVHAKYYNYEKCIQRIKKAYDQINALGSPLNISISPWYLSLKLEELQLSIDYEIMKKAERDRLLEYRQQLRENEKLEKELEEAREKVEKERQHYLRALAIIDAQIDVYGDDAISSDLSDQREVITKHIAEIDGEIEDIDYRQANVKAGYVYVISNIGSFGEGVLKIGMTRRLDPDDRIYELSGASVPFAYDVHAMIFTDDAPKLEASIHRALEKRRVNKVNSRKEFYRATIDEVKLLVFKELGSTAEFITFAEAQQYRESKLLSGDAVAEIQGDKLN